MKFSKLCFNIFPCFKELVHQKKSILDKQQISDNCFKYQEPDEPCDFVDNMQYYEDEDCLNGSTVFQEYDPHLIEEIQNH